VRESTESEAKSHIFFFEIIIGVLPLTTATNKY
jgi:hypothetical protein